MSTVYLFRYGFAKHPLNGLSRILERAELRQRIKGNSKVAIKLHMGELGNIRYIRPVFARKVVDLIKSYGGRPFLFDTICNYPGERSTKQKYLHAAECNGFVKDSVNAPIIITDDEDKLVHVKIAKRLDGCDLKEAVIPEILLGASFTIVLSHVKGHELTGFGGAVKNLAMGCVSNITKRAQHRVNLPVMKAPDACNGCGTCAEECVSEAIEIIDGKARRVKDECINCGSCYFVCSNNAWQLPDGAKEKLQTYLAHAASAVYTATKKNMLFVNFVQDVVSGCDCMAGSGEPIVQDIGILCSFDPVSIDKASLDLIDRAPAVAGCVSAEKNRMSILHGTDCNIQLKVAHELGMGSMDYKLIEVN